MSESWVKIYRNVLNNPVIAKDSFRLALWTVLLLKANYADSQIVVGGKKVTLHAGQLITGRKALAEQLHASESKVERCLILFEGEQMIEQLKTPRGRLITVKNWTNYQPDRTTNRTSTGQPANNQRTTIRTTNEQPTEQPEETEKTRVYKESEGITELDRTTLQTQTEQPEKMTASEIEHSYRRKNIEEEKIRESTREDFQQIIAAWNTLPDNIPKPREVVPSSARGKALNARIEENGLTGVLEAVENVKRSPFLLGKNKNGWKITFDWFVKSGNFQKIQEGNYNDGRTIEAETTQSGNKLPSSDDWMRNAYRI